MGLNETNYRLSFLVFKAVSANKINRGKNLTSSMWWTKKGSIHEAPDVVQECVTEFVALYFLAI